MNQDDKKEYSKWVGFGLIMGVALGYGAGLILSGIIYAPVWSAVGAGFGIVLGSIVGHTKIKGK